MFLSIFRQTKAPEETPSDEDESYDCKDDGELAAGVVGSLEMVRVAKSRHCATFEERSSGRWLAR